MQILISVYIQYKKIFSETVSSKNHGQVSFNKKIYYDAILVLFTATPYFITTSTNTGEKIFSPSSNMRKVFATKLHSSFGVTYHNIRYIGTKRWALNDKQYSFCRI